MLFEDITALNEVISLIRSDPQQRGKPSGRFRDIQDAEVDKLFSSSPPEIELSGTFELESTIHEDQKRSTDDNKDINSEVETSFQKNPIYKPRQLAEELFKPLPLPTTTSTKPRSALSQLLGSGVAGPPTPVASRRDGVPLTIYLPNREPMKVHVNPNDTVLEVIKATLRTHQSSLFPGTLHHHAPECYELRLHEGDGEPDEDFPALDRQRMLKQFGNVTEYCLCQKSGVPVPPSTSNAPPVTPTKDVLPSQVNMVMVTLPNAGHVKLRLDDSTTARDILPMIAKKHRLRLFTETYVFTMSAEDQHRLKLTSPNIDPNLPILSLGIRELELQKKVFADSPKVPISTSVSNAVHSRDERLSSSDIGIMYTDVTAAVYQEWNVVKKNKFGRMQKRVLGVDGHKIYNARRDSSSRTSSSVHRAQRDISTIRRVEPLEEDSRAFRITYSDEGEIYDIEYFCDSTQACAEIVAKINYLCSKKSLDTSKTGE